ncbi:acetate/propionate family kinase [Methylocystis sp. WRRC1]|uniref:acetate/propionate family kinase n=1 Tax=Methylocystis sp. WRRC1 TaxID=1732014 RepID=UPI001D15A6EE|nr:acetate/propionate family kinase [Methylocystis sp. WRRC1]MCC3246065.1 acetate/propionate family kinase [Methylocystis sp. WRRC1]
MTQAIVVINSGSTSLKFAGYATGQTLAVVCRGEVEGMLDHPRFSVSSSDGKVLATHDWGQGQTLDHKGALHFALSWMEQNIAGLKIVAAGHRVVQGGTRFAGPARIDAETLSYLDGLTVIEPSHQPYNVQGVKAIALAFPALPQVASFDTSFHHNMPEAAKTYAVSKTLRDAGVRHWGYHGISYDYISRQVKKVAPAARRVIAAHLGGGASMCAMLDGRSVETTMAFAGLTGLPMATRSGDVPADVLFYILRRGLLDVAGLEKSLYHDAGLLGLSELSGDMRELQDSKDPRAIAAVDYFVYSMTKYAGAYAAVLGGLDAFVFTAGIGENSASVRAALCEKLSWLAITLDPAANARNAERISTPESRVSVWVIPTNEELMIAEHTASVLGL